MSIRVLFAAAVVATAVSASPVVAQSSQIEKETLAHMFDGMRTQTSWDVDGPLLWGYYFTNGEKAPLEKAGALLEQDGYRFVGVYLADKATPSDPDLWWLHVERVERHSVDSLDQRNQQLYAFAAAQNLASYDGMDVGPAP